MKRIGAALLALLFAGLVVAGLGAQEAAEEPFTDEALFGGGENLVTEGGDSKTNAAESLLVSESVKIGGKFTMVLEGEGDSAGSFVPSTELGADIYADARPSDDFRVFVKGALTYPFQEASEAKITEAFADLVPLPGVFVRAGKQTANWGVGYYFSPANLLNLERVDPEDPEAELTGPLAIKAQVPSGTSNYYGYLLVREKSDGESLAFAPKLEKVFGSTEVSFGGLYEQDKPWATMATATGKLGDTDVFTELVFRGNEDKVFIVERPSSPSGITTEAREREVFTQSTVGFSWSWDDDLNRLGIILRAQYYYNGLGYEDTSTIREHRAAVRALLASEAIAFEDLAERGRHYGAASLSFTDILDSELGVSFFWLGNLADESGRTIATISWDRLDHLRLSAAYTYSYGTEGSEYAASGPESSVTLKLTVTEGTF